MRPILGIDRSVFGDPCDGSEFGYALDGGVGESWQDVGEIVADEYLKLAATIDDRQIKRYRQLTIHIN